MVVGVVANDLKLAIRSALNRLGKSTDIQRRGPNLERLVTPVLRQISLQAIFLRIALDCVPRQRAPEERSAEISTAPPGVLTGGPLTP